MFMEEAGDGQESRREARAGPAQHTLRSLQGSARSAVRSLTLYRIWRLLGTLECLGVKQTSQEPPRTGDKQLTAPFQM